MQRKYDPLGLHRPTAQALLVSILRDPDGWSLDVMREARLAAADRIEALQEAYENMRDFAADNGLDVRTYGDRNGQA